MPKYEVIRRYFVVDTVEANSIDEAEEITDNKDYSGKLQFEEVDIEEVEEDH